MAGFRKAKPEQAAIKLGLYGPAGSGKTFTALLLAEGLANGKKVAYVDTERGTDFYCQAIKERHLHPDAFEFDALYTRSISEVVSSVNGLDAEQYGVIVIDSITHLWEACIASYRGKTTSAGTIPFHAWGKIKRPYKLLMTGLLNSPMHVLICGREKNEYGEDADSGELKMLGKAMRAEGETPYEPHVLIRMQRERVASGIAPVSAFVEKDRSGVLAGRVILLPPDQPDGFTFQQIGAPLLAALSGGSQGQIDDVDTAAAKDAEAFSEEDAKREIESAETRDYYIGRFMSARDLDEVKAAGKEITPEMKKNMLKPDVDAMRDAWRAAEKRLS